MQSHVKLALQVCNCICGCQKLVCVKRRVQNGKQRFQKICFKLIVQEEFCTLYIPLFWGSSIKYKRSFT